MAISSTSPQEALKLDLYDKKILYSLSKNSRIPMKQLAKQLRISQQRLHYKLQRLTEELIDPLVLINYQAIGINMYLLFIQKLSEENKQKLMEDPSVAFFMQTVGKYQYILNVITKNINEFCKRLLPESNIEILEVTRQIPDSYNPFLIGKSVEPIKKDQKIKLDKKDITILLQLSKNPMGPILELSKTTGIDRQTIKARMQKMEEANIIQTFRYSMNIFRLGYLGYFLKVSAVPASQNKIFNEIRNDPYSGMVFVTHNGLYFFYMPPSHKELFTFIEKIQIKDPTVNMEILQNTEYFKISHSQTNELKNLCENM